MKTLKLSEQEATRFFAVLFGGEHHIPGHKVTPLGVGGFYVDSAMPMATYDGSLLTKLVFLAHDKAIRAEINPCKGGKMRISIFKRCRRGAYYEKHPELLTAYGEWRHD